MTRVNLSTSNSKGLNKLKKDKMFHIFVAVAKVLLIAILFILVMSGINRFLTYLLVDDTKQDDYSRRTIYELYNQENIDALFLGSSHCFMGINPAIIDKETGKKTFNAGTVSQLYNGSYALLKEADKLYDIEEVYMDMYYAQGLIDDVIDDRTYIISDNMKPSLNKVEYVCGASDKESWISTFFPARRNWRNLFDYEEISKITEEKNKEEYKNYTNLSGPVAEYKIKGFVGFKRQQQPEHNWFNEYFDSVPENYITQKNEKELKKIIDYCDKHGIKLTFIVIPMSDLMLSNIGNYDYYITNMSTYASQNSLDFVDFNLCSREYFSNNDTLFYDEGHLNEEGANVFSELLAEYMLGNISKDEMFFNSYIEKVDVDEFKILGYFDILTEDESRLFEISDNGKRLEEYKAELIIQDEEGALISRSLLQDYSDNKIYEIPRGEYSTLKIEHREKGTTKSKTIEYTLKPRKK